MAVQTQATSVLTFSDLILEVARAMGVAYYGANGDEVAQVPTDVHDLAEAKRHVNNAIRQIFSDAPAPGWRWSRINYDFVLWADVASPPPTLTFTFGSATAAPYIVTQVTANQDFFFEGMVGKQLNMVDGTKMYLVGYESPTVMYAQGDQSAVNGAQSATIFNLGGWTMPAFYTGMHEGEVTYSQDQNLGFTIRWTSETDIRRWRENALNDQGDPYLGANRRLTVPQDVELPSMRWEIITYPRTQRNVSINIPFRIYSNELSDLTDRVSWPIYMDNVVKAACLSVVYQDVDGPNAQAATARYQADLQGAYQLDAQTAPRKLGYFGNDIGLTLGDAGKAWRNNVYDRPAVSFG